MLQTIQNVSDTSVPQVARFTANLAQAAATYTLCTAGGGAVLVDIGRMAMYVSTVGATLTSVSIQTNQTNSTQLLSAVEGAVANLVVQKNLVRVIPVVGSVYLASGQTITYTIVGATGTGAILVTVPYFPVDAGARLS